LEGKDFLMMAHPQLRQADPDPVQAYADYRSSPAGGSHDVLLLDIDQVYHQFNYGDPSPIAITRLIQSGYPNIKSAFLIGRGLTVNTNMFRSPSGEPFIPTYGLPGGDFMYGINLNTGNALLPEVPVGLLISLTPA
jgi:hypothetical protein